MRKERIGERRGATAGGQKRGFVYDRVRQPADAGTHRCLFTEAREAFYNWIVSVQHGSLPVSDARMRGDLHCRIVEQYGSPYGFSSCVIILIRVIRVPVTP